MTTEKHLENVMHGFSVLQAAMWIAAMRTRPLIHAMVALVVEVC